MILKSQLLILTASMASMVSALPYNNGMYTQTAVTYNDGMYTQTAGTWIDGSYVPSSDLSKIATTSSIQAKKHEKEETVTVYETSTSTYIYSITVSTLPETTEAVATVKPSTLESQVVLTSSSVISSPSTTSSSVISSPSTTSSSVISSPSTTSSSVISSPSTTSSSVISSPSTTSSTVISSPSTTSSTVISPSSTASSSSAKITGDATYYDITVGQVACGGWYKNSDNVIAVALLLGKSYCGKKVSITGASGQSVEATVVDLCEACGVDDIDLTEDLFTSIGYPLSKGRVSVGYEYI